MVPNPYPSTSATKSRAALFVAMAFVLTSGFPGLQGLANAATRFVGPTSSQPLALTADDGLLAVANPDNNSVTIFDVRSDNNREGHRSAGAVGTERGRVHA